jgi:hypothetical protein
VVGHVIIVSEYVDARLIELIEPSKPLELGKPTVVYIMQSVKQAPHVGKLSKVLKPSKLA